MLKKIINFYIKSSLHVGLSCYSFIGLTNFYFKITMNNPVQYFGLFATVLAYNSIKFGTLFFSKPIRFCLEIKFIFAINLIALMGSLYFFLRLNFISKCLIIFILTLLFLYTIPIFKTKRNLRNQPFLKIYLVAISWVLVTVILPVINANMFVVKDITTYFFQRFLFLFSLILVFDIVDLKFDNLSLKTIPQCLGVFRTKILGCSLIVFTIILSHNYSDQNFLPNILLMLFLVFASPNRTSFYSLFFAESIPILWYCLILI